MATLPQRLGAPMGFMEFMKSQPGVAGYGVNADCTEALNMRRMIDELERTRARYESEQSNTASFGEQMNMISTQMSSLTEQQQSLLGFHITRINSMIDELRKSTSTMERHEREKRAHNERERREREERERIERETREHFEREHRQREERERIEKEERERFEREQRERRGKEEREHEEKQRQEQEAKLREEFLNSPKVVAPPSTTTTSSASSALAEPEDLDMSALPDMDLGDVKSFPEFVEFMKQQQQQAANTSSQPESMNPLALDTSIPLPSRTVTPTSQKRRRSFAEATSATKNDRNGQNDALSLRPSSPANKKAKAIIRNRVVAQQPDNERCVNTGGQQQTTPPMVGDEGADMNPFGTTSLDDSIPAELQAQLQAQALAMLQAQLEKNEAEKLATAVAMDTSPDDVENPIAPPKELTPPRAKPPGSPARNSKAPTPSSAIASTGSVKPEPGTTVVTHTPYPITKLEPIMQSSSSSSSAAGPKRSVKKKKKTPAKKGGAVKSEPVQAVEDTTIANPESVPLKNKAIHQWMAKDPDRLYTADDIVNAGIRYRQTHNGNGKRRGGVYILEDRKQIRSALLNGSKLFWQSSGRGKWTFLKEPIGKTK